MKRYIRSASIDSELSNKIEDAWLATLFEYGVEADEVHLIDFNDARKLESIFVRKLKEQGVDLQGQRAMLWPGFYVSGNLSSIANQLIRENVKSGWHRIDFTVDDLLDYESGDLYEEDKYGYCEPCSEDRARALLNEPTGSFHHGYGSQAYISDAHLRVYKDDFGNVKFERYTEIWD